MAKRSRLTESLLPPWRESFAQPVKKFPTFYESQRFIAAFTTARPSTLSWVIWIRLNPLTLFFKINFNIVFACTPSSSKLSVPLNSSDKICISYMHISALWGTGSVHLIPLWFEHPNRGYQCMLWCSSLCSFSQRPVIFPCLVHHLVLKQSQTTFLLECDKLSLSNIQNKRQATTVVVSIFIHIDWWKWDSTKRVCSSESRKCNALIPTGYWKLIQ
jgi:hypothetical protein